MGLFRQVMRQRNVPVYGAGEGTPVLFYTGVLFVIGWLKSKIWNSIINHKVL